MRRAPLYNDFVEWFHKSRDLVDVPSYAELSVRYEVSADTIGKWVSKLGGFKHSQQRRSLLCKVDAAHEYLKGCSRPIGVKALMIAAGYSVRSASGTNPVVVEGFLKCLQERYPEDLAKIKRWIRDNNSDYYLLKWGRSYLRRHGYPAPVVAVAKRIGRSGEYARKRVEALLNAYPDAPFVLGNGWKELRQDDSRCKRGRRKRGSEWDQWKAERCPDCLGFEFRGATWERYLKLWDLRRRGYSWAGSGGGFVEFEKGHAVKLCTKRQCTIEEAMNEAL